MEDDQSACHVKTVYYTQDIVDHLLFNTTGEEHTTPKDAIKEVVNSITVDDESLEIDEEAYYLLLALLNGFVDNTSPDEAIVSRGDWLGNPANFKGPSLCCGLWVVT